LIMTSDRGSRLLHELTGREAGLLYLLFPHLSGLDVDHVEDLDGSVKIVARTASGPVACRDCGTLPARVHDRYRRCLHDLACGGRSVLAGLEVRRLICDNPACPVATFAEQVDGLTARHQRRTAGLAAAINVGSWRSSWCSNLGRPGIQMSRRVLKPDDAVPPAA
jgi:hypothetical protein